MTLWRRYVKTSTGRVHVGIRVRHASDKQLYFIIDIIYSYFTKKTKYRPEILLSVMLVSVELGQAYERYTLREQIS